MRKHSAFIETNEEAAIKTQRREGEVWRGSVLSSNLKAQKTLVFNYLRAGHEPPLGFKNGGEMF